MLVFTCRVLAGFGYGAPPPPPDQFAPPGVPPPPATPGAAPLAFPPPPPPSQATQDMSKPPTAQPEFPYSQFGEYLLGFIPFPFTPAYTALDTLCCRRFSGMGVLPPAQASLKSCNILARGNFLSSKVLLLCCKITFRDSCTAKMNSWFPLLPNLQLKLSTPRASQSL